MSFVVHEPIQVTLHCTVEYCASCQTILEYQCDKKVPIVDRQYSDLQWLHLMNKTGHGQRPRQSQAYQMELNEL